MNQRDNPNLSLLKMDRFIFIFVAVIPFISHGLIVHGPSGPLVAPLGSSVILPCYVDESLSIEDLEVEWKRTDSETLVHLYQDGKSRPEAQQQDYQDRAHFFTEHIKDGNFSLHLDNLRAEDKGEYTCKVYTQQGSGGTVVQIKDVERLLVLGSDDPVSASVGEDVTLNCSVDSHINPEDFEQVSWKKTDEDGEILVLLYQDNETLPEASDELYRDRVEFFTAEIPKGNFSLKLKSVRTEDKGVYLCQVFAGVLSANTTAVLDQTGFSVSLIIVLILCISASGSALLLCCLIYCRSHNEDTVFCLHMFLVFCPNILMFLGFLLWGLSEGSLFETVSCCALYFLRPLMLLWAAPYVNEFTGKKTFIKCLSQKTEYVVFSTVFYSVLFKSALDKSLKYLGFEGIMIIVLFLIVLLFNLIYFIFLLARFHEELNIRITVMFCVLAGIIFDVLPSLQFVLLFYTFGTRGGFFIVSVLPVFLTMTKYNWNITCGEVMGCSLLVRRSVWFIVMLLVSTVMVYFYLIAVENEKDRIGWGCMIVFLQSLWEIVNFTHSFESDFPRVVVVYVFGSVGVVLLSSIILMAELILKAVNGDRAVGDLRLFVFPAEFLFSFSLLILMVFQPWIETCLQSRQNATGSDETPASGSNQRPSTAESHEMNPLLNRDQEAGRSDVTENDQLDSLESQR